MASKPQVADIAAERFERLEAENAALRARLSENERKLWVFCQQYSQDHRYCVTLTREQVKRAMRRG